MLASNMDKMPISPQEQSGDNLPGDTRKFELALYLDLYKTHYDLFLKGVAVYLAIVGAIATITFQNINGARTLKCVLSLFICACSLLAVAASQVCRLWVAETQTHLHRICASLHIPVVSLQSARRIGTLVLFLAVSFVVASIFIFLWFLRH